MPLLLYLSINSWCLNIFCIVFICAECNFYLCVSERFCNFPYLFSALCKCGPFCFLLLCVSVCVSLFRVFIAFVDIISVIK
jgi:hypothetical protein